MAAVVNKEKLVRLRMARCLTLNGIVALGGVFLWGWLCPVTLPESMPPTPAPPLPEVIEVELVTEPVPAPVQAAATDDIDREFSAGNLENARQWLERDKLGYALRYLDDAVDWDPANAEAQALRRDVTAMLAQRAAEARGRRAVESRSR